MNATWRSTPTVADREVKQGECSPRGFTHSNDSINTRWLPGIRCLARETQHQSKQGAGVVFSGSMAMMFRSADPPTKRWRVHV